MREHVSDVATPAMLDMLEAHCPPGTATLSDARRSIPASERDRFEQLLIDCQRATCWSGIEDPIEIIRSWQEAQMLMPGVGVLPRLEEISFSDAASLKQCIARFVNDASLRDAVVCEQRASIVSRLTYSSTMKRVSRRIGELLSTNRSESFESAIKALNLGKAA